MSHDPLAIIRGLALTDAGLEESGLDRSERLEIWQASQRAMAMQSDGLGLGGWLIPGVHLELDIPRVGSVQAELGWPEIAAGPSMMRLPLRRFGSWSWDLDGGSWAPGWWGRVQRRISIAAWDRAEDERLIAEDIEASFVRAWISNRWDYIGWRYAPPGWVERIFARNQEAMKRGLLEALDSPERGSDVVHAPVLAGGTRLEKATVRSLRDAKTTIFVPSEAGYRAFLENVRTQKVAKHLAMSMAFTWWTRHFEGEAQP